MKSSLRFFLNGDNKSIITGEVKKSEDVRDTIAERFVSSFGEHGRLALCQFMEKDITHDAPPQDESRLMWKLKIEPFGSDKEECRRIAKHLDISQMVNLVEAFNERIKAATIKNNSIDNHNQKKDMNFNANADIIEKSFRVLGTILYMSKIKNKGKKIHFDELKNSSLNCKGMNDNDLKKALNFLYGEVYLLNKIDETTYSL